MRFVTVRASILALFASAAACRTPNAAEPIDAAETDACVPKTKSAACAVTACGLVDDGCGGQIDCGTAACTGSTTCGGGGAPNACGAPVGVFDDHGANFDSCLFQ